MAGQGQLCATLGGVVMVVIVPQVAEETQSIILLIMGCGWLIWKLLISELLKLKEV
jgi:hypothetical protein